MPSASLGERAKDVAKTMPQATLARMFRFCAAYGIGGLMNKALLKNGKAYVAEQHGVKPIDPKLARMATVRMP